MEQNFETELSKAFAKRGMAAEINANGRILVVPTDPDISEWFFLSSLDGKEWDYSGFSKKDAAEFAKEIAALAAAHAQT